MWMVSCHMHILGREVKAWAELPGGKTQPFVWIKDWDFHWAERYELATPLKLPKGTVIKVEGFYDNSADNPRNPNSPPKEVRYGNNLTDEMLGCSLQVIVPSLGDLRVLESMRGKRGDAPEGTSTERAPESK
jgi:hypothetical protein